MSYIAELNLKGGADVEAFAEAVLKAVEDEKITPEEFAEIQTFYNRLSPSEQEKAVESLSRSNTFSSSYQSLEGILARGTYDEFVTAVTVNQPG